jgi:hypothetical protein
MKTIFLGLPVMICTVAIAAASCGKKDVTPEPQEAGSEVEKPPPEPVQETADAAAEQDTKMAGELDAGQSDAGSQPSTAQEIAIHFRGKVGWIKMLSKIGGTVYPVGADPDFAVSVSIETVDEKDVPFQAGTTVVFAIHSPAKTFMTSADWKSVAGHQYDFELNATKSAEGQWSYYFLAAKPTKK